MVTPDLHESTSRELIHLKQSETRWIPFISVLIELSG